ncbi:MAG: endonuclease III [Proteobacteria bacterium]|jgi:endonuclease-3|nr:endonuclease III [Pseudomonadota bacterium]
MKAEAREAMFERLRARNPNPTTELEYRSAFELLIAVILSAQATDRSVNLATRKLFTVAGTPAEMLALGEPRLAELIRTIGLYKTKAKNVIATCGLLLERHSGEVPRTREALEALPGVGRKTANVVLNTAFGEPTMAVDTHIFRVANRTGLAPGRTPLAVEKKLMRAVPAAYLMDAHHWLILHGRYLCKARKPDCPACPIADLCAFKRKTRATDDGAAPR